MSYAQLGDLQQRLGVNSTTDDAILQASLDWADEFIYAYTDRYFSASTATRYFGPDRLLFEEDNPYYRGNLTSYNPYTGMYLPYKVLLLDEDLLSVSALHNADTNSTLITSGQYRLEPWNAPSDNKPYSQIRLLTNYSWSFDTDGRISVAGSWGYSTEPDAFIINTAMLLAEWHYRRRVPQDVTTIFDAKTKKTKLEGFPTEVLDVLMKRRRLFD